MLIHNYHNITGSRVSQRSPQANYVTLSSTHFIKVYYFIQQLVSDPICILTSCTWKTKFKSTREYLFMFCSRFFYIVVVVVGFFFFFLNTYANLVSKYLLFTSVKYIYHFSFLCFRCWINNTSNFNDWNHIALNEVNIFLRQQDLSPFVQYNPDLWWYNVNIKLLYIKFFLVLPIYFFVKWGILIPLASLLLPHCVMAKTIIGQNIKIWKLFVFACDSFTLIFILYSTSCA